MNKKFNIEATYGRGMYEVDERGVIVSAAPIWAKWIGKRAENLEKWVGLYKGSITEIFDDREYSKIPYESSRVKKVMKQ